MSDTALHPTPTNRAVLREQFRSIGAGNRTEMFGLAILLLAIFALTFGREPTTWQLSAYPHLTAMLGLATPFAVWKAAGWSDRAYGWSLPVSHATYSLFTVLTGWIWLVAFVGAGMVGHLLMILGAGGQVTVGAEVAQPITRYWPGGIESIDLSLGGQAWYWLVPFTSATVAYLAGTFVILASRHPFRWIAAVGIIGAILGERFSPLRPLIQGLVNGRYGLSGWTSGFVREPYEVDQANRTVEILVEQPDLWAWLIATSLWGGTALLCVLLAAYRHPDE